MKTIIITGTTQGLGSRLFERLAAKADGIIPINRRSINNPDEILCDLASKEAVNRASSQLSNKLLEKSDVLFVLNAGDYGTDQTVSDVTPETLGKLLYVNVFGQLTLVEDLVKTGHKVRLVAISSGMGSITIADEPYHYAYSVSKSALNHCVRLLRLQYKAAFDYMLIDPSWMRTQMGGMEARVDPANTAKFIVEALDDSAKWNRADGMINAETGEIVPW